jgi:hypothetical protein
MKQEVTFRAVIAGSPTLKRMREFVDVMALLIRTLMEVVE